LTLTTAMLDLGKVTSLSV